MASGSVIGTLVAVPFSLGLAQVLTPLAPLLKAHIGPIFLLGAVCLALLFAKGWIALLSILPFALLIQLIQRTYWRLGAVPYGETVFISFFLGITIGPMILSMIELLVPKRRKQKLRREPRQISLAPDAPLKKFPNPFKILDKRELSSAVLGSIVGSAAFFMSPCGLTVPIGEALSSRIKDPVRRACRAVSTMDVLTNATYLSGTLIPLIALGIPFSPMALGPARPLFEAPPRFAPGYNLHELLTPSDFVLATVIGAAIALLITYPITVKYARRIAEFCFKNISHEALISLFFALVVLLAWMDAGLVGVRGVILIATIGGVLNRLGVHLGIQFMVYYCSSWLFSTLFSLA